MIESIDIINKTLSESLSMTSDSGGYILDNIDWGMPSVSFNQYRVPFQIGETLDSVVIGTRIITITGYVISDLYPDADTWEEYNKVQEKDIEDKKLYLDRIFNVNQDIQINVGEYQIVGRPTQFPRYSINEDENNEVLCVYTVEIQCYSPMFTKGEKAYTMIGVDKAFHFPLIIPINKGVIFGVRTRVQALIVKNDGDVETGMILTVEAVTGDVINPKVYNIQTNESIEFVGLTLHKGDRLTVNTNIGEESAVHYDSDNRTNNSVVGKMSVDSKFLRIPQGVSFLMYDLENETFLNSNITISFFEQYANIRGM